MISNHKMVLLPFLPQTRHLALFWESTHENRAIRWKFSFPVQLTEFWITSSWVRGSQGSRRAQIPLFIPVEMEWIPPEKSWCSRVQLDFSRGFEVFSIGWMANQAKYSDGWQIKQNYFPRTLFAKILLWNVIIPEIFLLISQILWCWKLFHSKWRSERGGKWWVPISLMYKSEKCVLEFGFDEFGVCTCWQSVFWGSFCCTSELISPLSSPILKQSFSNAEILEASPTPSTIFSCSSSSSASFKNLLITFYLSKKVVLVVGYLRKSAGRTVRLRVPLLCIWFLPHIPFFCCSHSSLQLSPRGCWVWAGLIQSATAAEMTEKTAQSFLHSGSVGL